MANLFEDIGPQLVEWIERQPMFFVASAPLDGDGHVNVSPKGPIGALRVLDERTVAYLDVSGSGLADMTRLARSSYDLWRDILATNSEHIDQALGEYVQELEHIRENLRTRQLQEEFERGARMSKRLR